VIRQNLQNVQNPDSVNSVHSVEKNISELHHWYCSRTGLRTKLCFSERLWFDRLRDYDYDETALRNDCELIVRYLKREIARDKRNLGALKLSNFLQPDNFDADLAIAKLGARKNKSGNQETRKPELQRPKPEEFEQRARAGAEQLRKFRQSMTGP
jgi:hypothetical protein